MPEIPELEAAKVALNARLAGRVIEAARVLVSANRQLIERVHERKIEDVVARVWGEDEQSAISAAAAG